MKTIITINGDSYLIPEEQAKELPKVLDQIMAWRPVNKTYGQKNWQIEEDDVIVSITKVSDEKVKELGPEAA